MRNDTTALAILLLLSACSSGDVAGDSDELAIENAAKSIDAASDADAKRIIADIEANTPKVSAEAAKGSEPKQE